MKANDVLKLIFERCPERYAMDWDNVGLIAGRGSKEIKSVFIALDATDKVISEAIERKADLLLTHHPLIFSAIKKVTDADFISRRLLRILQEDMAYIAMHTNYDVAVMADLCAGRFGLKEQRVLSVTAEEDGHELGIGKCGKLDKAYTLRQLSERVKKTFEIPSVRCYGDPEKVITNIAMCPGSGKAMEAEALEKGAQVLITGDLGHHDCIDAVMQGLAVIDAGHYGLEHVFVEDMAAFLSSRCSDMIICKERTKMPYSDI